jgi:hypothetical protein
MLYSNNMQFPICHGLFERRGLVKRGSRDFSESRRVRFKERQEFVVTTFRYVRNLRSHCSIMSIKLLVCHILAISSTHVWMMQLGGPLLVLAKRCEAADRSFECHRRP